jgi:hypothetical protein
MTACVLSLFTAQCAPDSSTSYRSPVGSTATVAPATELALRSAVEAANSAKVVHLAMRWNGTAMEQIVGTVELRFYRDGEELPFLETTWQELVRSSKTAGCPEAEGMGDESQVSLCDGRLGNLGTVARIEGTVRDSGERKVAINLSPVQMGYETARLLVLLY